MLLFLAFLRHLHLGLQPVSYFPFVSHRIPFLVSLSLPDSLITATNDFFLSLASPSASSLSPVDFSPLICHIGKLLQNQLSVTEKSFLLQCTSMIYHFVHSHLSTAPSISSLFPTLKQTFIHLFDTCCKTLMEVTPSPPTSPLPVLPATNLHSHEWMEKIESSFILSFSYSESASNDQEWNTITTENFIQSKQSIFKVLLSTISNYTKTQHFSDIDSSQPNNSISPLANIHGQFLRSCYTIKLFTHSAGISPPPSSFLLFHFPHL